ncbi:MAG: hypothetical protein AAFX98_09565 [Pseudomonadota bacterium]
MSATEIEEVAAAAEPAARPRFTNFDRADSHGGYSAWSLVVHWIGFAIVAGLAYMLVEQGWYETPQPLDLAVALFLIYQCLRRFGRGFPRNANTWLPAAFVYRLAQVIMVTAIGAFGLAGLCLIVFAGSAAPSIFGFVIFEFFNEPLPWWQAQAELVYRTSALAFAGGAAVTLLAVSHYAFQKGMPNLKRLIFPAASGR